MQEPSRRSKNISALVQIQKYSQYQSLASVINHASTVTDSGVTPEVQPANDLYRNCFESQPIDNGANTIIKITKRRLCEKVGPKKNQLRNIKVYLLVFVFWTTLSLTTIMSSERPSSTKDKIARSFGKLSRLWRPEVSSPMNMDSSPDSYIAKTDTGYVFQSCMYDITELLGIGSRTDRSAKTLQASIETFTTPTPPMPGGAR